MTSAVILRSSPHAPEAQPLIEDLIREYDIRYGTTFDPAGARAEVYRYPPEAFAPPTGDFLLSGGRMRQSAEGRSCAMMPRRQS